MTPNTGYQSYLGFVMEKPYFCSWGLLLFLTNNLSPDNDETVAVAATESGYHTEAEG